MENQKVTMTRSLLHWQLPKWEKLKYSHIDDFWNEVPYCTVRMEARQIKM